MKVLTVVKHAMATIYFRVELSDHAGEKDHGQTRHQEHVGQPAGESPKLSVFDRSSGTFDDKDNQDNHELTSQDVTVKVVALVDDGRASVRPLVRVLEKVFVNGSQTDNGALSSFHHGQPRNGSKENEHGHHRMHVMGAFRLLGVDETENDGEAKDEEDRRVDILEHLDGRATDSGCDCHGEVGFKGTWYETQERYLVM